MAQDQWKSPVGWSTWQAWNRQKDKGPGFGDTKWWTTVDKEGTSPYQRFNRTGEWRSGEQKLGADYKPAGGWNTMDPRREAQLSMDLEARARQAGLNRFVTGQQQMLNQSVNPAFRQVKEYMAGKGLLNSTGTGTRMMETYNQIASPILNSIANANQENQSWMNDAGNRTAQYYQDLARKGRDEGRADRNFYEARRQADRGSALDLYNTLYAGALGRGQIQQDFGGIDFPSTAPWMYDLIQRGYGQMGDPIEQGHGPIGDAGEKKGTKPGTTQYNLKSYARERAGVEDSFRAQAMALQKAQEARQSEADVWDKMVQEAQLEAAGFKLDPTSGRFVRDPNFVSPELKAEKDKEEAAFRTMLSQQAWANGGKGSTLAQLRAIASANNRDLANYTNLLSPHLRDAMRQERGNNMVDYWRTPGMEPENTRTNADEFMQGIGEGVRYTVPAVAPLIPDDSGESQAATMWKRLVDWFSQAAR